MRKKIVKNPIHTKNQTLGRCTKYWKVGNFLKTFDTAIVVYNSKETWKA